VQIDEDNYTIMDVLFIFIASPLNQLLRTIRCTVQIDEDCCESSRFKSIRQINL
jgi:hypothetical protein